MCVPSAEIGPIKTQRRSDQVAYSLGNQSPPCWPTAEHLLEFQVTVNNYDMPSCLWSPLYSGVTIRGSSVSHKHLFIFHLDIQYRAGEAISVILYIQQLESGIVMYSAFGRVQVHMR